MRLALIAVLAGFALAGVRGHGLGAAPPAAAWSWETVVKAWQRPEGSKAPAAESAELRALLVQAAEVAPVESWRLRCVARLVARSRPDLAPEAITALAATFARTIAEPRIALMLGPTQPQIRVLATLYDVLQAVPPGASASPALEGAVAALDRAQLRGAANALRKRLGVAVVKASGGLFALDVLFDEARLSDALVTAKPPDAPSGWEWLFAWPAYVKAVDLSAVTERHRRVDVYVSLCAGGPAGVRRGLMFLDPASRDERQSIWQGLVETPFGLLQATHAIDSGRAPDPTALGIFATWDGTERCAAWTEAVSKLKEATVAGNSSVTWRACSAIHAAPAELLYRTAAVQTLLRKLAAGEEVTPAPVQAYAIRALHDAGLNGPSAWSFDSEGKVASEQVIALRNSGGQWRLATLELVEPLLGDERPSSLGHRGPSGLRTTPLGDVVRSELFIGIEDVLGKRLDTPGWELRALEELRADRLRWLLAEE